MEQPRQEKTICPLNTHAHRFVGLVQMERVMLLLYGAGALTIDKYKMIMSQPSLEQQIVCMLDTVQRGGRDGIRKLIVCIENEDEHLGHQELAADLKRGMPHIILTYIIIRNYSYLCIIIIIIIIIYIFSDPQTVVVYIYIYIYIKNINILIN